MRLGIQKKAITAISLLVMVLAFSLMSLALYHGGKVIRAELARRGSIATNNLAYNAPYATLIGDTSAITDLLNGVLAEKEVLYARIVEPSGDILAQVERAGHGRIPPLIRGEGLSGHAPGISATVYDDPDDKIHFLVPIVLRDQKNSEMGVEYGFYNDMGGATSPDSEKILGYAQVGMTTHYVEEAIADMRGTMLTITLFMVLVAMLITSIVVRWGIRPINDLAAATGRVAAGDYNFQVGVNRSDEIGDLAAAFNKMTADLSASRKALVEKELLEALVSELKQTQQQLIQAGKMAALGQLAAGVAHEINNPLAGIMGYAQLAGENLRSKQETGIPATEVSKFVAYIENMERQSQRCKQIVQNLLRFARASSQQEVELVDCNTVLRETLTFLSHEMTANSIVLETRFDPHLPSAEAHAGKLQQVFTNILINAVQAIVGAGKITVETQSQDGWVRVVISDTGVGIPSEYMDKIFEPFFTTKEIGRGTGLGLAVSYGLVKDMGGRIEAQSVVGRGTTFTISFPEASSVPAVPASGDLDANVPIRSTKEAPLRD